MHSRKVETVANDGLSVRRLEPEAPSRSATVLLVDDRALRRAALTRLLEGWARAEDLALAIVAVATPEQAGSVEDIRLVLISAGEKPVGAPEMLLPMAELARRIPAAAMVVLSERNRAADAVAALRAGACGFVAMGAEPGLVLHALQFILGGGTYFPPEALLAFGEDQESRQRDATGGPALPANTEGKAITTRQGEVLDLLRRGLANKEIARALGMSEATVKVHVRQIMRKLGAANRTQVALRAR